MKRTIGAGYPMKLPGEPNNAKLSTPRIMVRIHRQAQFSGVRRRSPRGVSPTAELHPASACGRMVVAGDLDQVGLVKPNVSEISQYTGRRTRVRTLREPLIQRQTFCQTELSGNRNRRYAGGACGRLDCTPVLVCRRGYQCFMYDLIQLANV